MTGQHRENTTSVIPKPDAEPVISGKVKIDGQASRGNVSFDVLEFGSFVIPQNKLEWSTSNNVPSHRCIVCTVPHLPPRPNVPIVVCVVVPSRHRVYYTLQSTPHMLYVRHPYETQRGPPTAERQT